MTEPFVDTHVHFWDHSVEGLSWAWLDPDFRHPRVASLHRYDAPRFAAAELREEVEGAGVSGVVHVQAARWNGAPERESAWLEELGDEAGWPDVVVGACRMADDDAPRHIERQLELRRFRGVRDLGAGAHLDDPALDRPLEVLAQCSGVFELLVSFEGFDGAARVAERHPGVTFVLDHAGLPVERTPEYHERWSGAMHRLARVGNVVCKISALAGGVDPSWTVESLRPWVEGCIEAFGPERCMFGSNWPIDKPYGSYARLVEAYREIVRPLSAAERGALMRATARRVYRM